MQAIFMDIETSGLDPFHHVALEIAFKIIDLTTGEEQACYQKIIKHCALKWQERDLTSVEVNGFTWDKLQQGNEQEEVKNEIITIFNQLQIARGSSVYICQNPAFDRNFFAQIIDIYTQEYYHWPYHWLDFASMFWALQVKNYQDKHEPLPREMNLSKNAIAQQYQLPTEDLPHGALNGVNHLILCYQTVIGIGPFIQSTCSSAKVIN